jgi:hypothetical protein
LDWFKSTPQNPNPSGVVVTVGGNTDGSNIYGNVAFGNPNGPTAFGYSADKGWGLGYSQNGNTNMYYPGYNYNAPEQAAAKAYDDAVNPAINNANQSYLWTKNDNWWSNTKNYLGLVSESAYLTTRWLVGANSDALYLNGNVANALRSSAGVTKALKEYYATRKTFGKYGFGLTGLYDAGFNPVQQFVGSYGYKITEIEGRLQFTITNTTSFGSAAYHLWPYKWNWEKGPMSNFKQTYIFIY